MLAWESPGVDRDAVHGHRPGERVPLERAGDLDLPLLTSFGLRRCCRGREDVFQSFGFADAAKGEIVAEAKRESCERVEDEAHPKFACALLEAGDDREEEIGVSSGAFDLVRRQRDLVRDRVSRRHLGLEALAQFVDRIGADSVSVTTGQGGRDRHLNFYELRDNLWRDDLGHLLSFSR